jgi:uncharacterized protein YlxP (DUF503 family)
MSPSGWQPLRWLEARAAPSPGILSLHQTMPVGLLILNIHLPDAHSLKEKRLTVHKIQDRLRARFNVAVAELDHQDLWQRAEVGVVSIASDRKVLEKILRAVEEESHHVLGRELVGTESEVF